MATYCAFSSLRVTGFLSREPVSKPERGKWWPDECVVLLACKMHLRWRSFIEARVDISTRMTRGVRDGATMRAFVVCVV